MCLQIFKTLLFFTVYFQDQEILFAFFVSSLVSARRESKVRRGMCHRRLSNGPVHLRHNQRLQHRCLRQPRSHRSEAGCGQRAPGSCAGPTVPNWQSKAAGISAASHLYGTHADSRVDPIASTVQAVQWKEVPEWQYWFVLANAEWWCAIRARYHAHYAGLAIQSYWSKTIAYLFSFFIWRHRKNWRLSV